MSFRMPLWMKLFLFAFMLLVPTVFVLAYSLNTSLSFLADLAINSDIEDALRTNIESMHRLKDLLPESSVQDLERMFNRDLATYQAYSQLKTLKVSLLGELQRHALIVGFVSLLISLIFAYFLARSILKLFKSYAQKLLDREHQHVLLSSLENWQSVSQSVIHELKSSLTPLKLISSRKIHSSEDEDESAVLILGEVKKMEVLIDELTNFARLPRPDLSAMDLVPTLEYFVQNSVIDGLRIEFDPSELQKHQNSAVAHDPSMIQRLLYNLMRNSKEANPELENLQITISAKVFADVLELHLRDNGGGIPVHKLRVIFESRHSQKPQSSISDSFPRLPTNLGLGLTISKKIALDHGGDLYGVPSSKGAHFILKLPLAHTHENYNEELNYV